jgi:polysaccharide biosynthesis protein PslH
MMPPRLKILWLLPMPPSPPRFGAQARMHGLLSEFGRRHDITAVALIDPAFDRNECELAMRAYCREVVTLPNQNGREGRAKRLLQLRSLLSLHSYEWHRFAVPGLQATLDHLLRRERFDVVHLEFPYLAHYRLRQAPAGERLPAVIVDTHEIAYDLARQMAQRGGSGLRRAYGATNWRKLRREERGAFRTADGLCACSEVDRVRLLAEASGARAVVVPNAADVEHYRPRQSDPPIDDGTILFFGLLSTYPNIDGLRFFTQDVWPRVRAARPDARFRIVGARAGAEVRELVGDGIELVGFVPDLRPELAAAGVVVVPLRVGGGTRLKIVEAMAMGKAIVSTSLGAEGIDGVSGRDLVIADEAERFAAEVVRLLDDRRAAAEIGRAGRELAVARYAWSAAARDLERLFLDVLSVRASATDGPPQAGDGAGAASPG